MSRYRKLSKIEHDDDDDHDMSYHPSQSRSESGWDTEKLILPGCMLGLLIYIAVALTAVCALQYIASQKPESDPGGLRAKIRGGYYEWEFVNNHSYESLDHQYDHLWEWPSGTDILIDEPVLGTHQKVVAGFSMFHQLHCLQMIRMTVQQSQELTEMPELDTHILHCFDYLWKSILCAADNTVELPSIKNGTFRNNVIDGEGGVHMCTNPKSLFELRKWKMPDLVAMQLDKARIA